ncbi:MAG TPA: cyclic nucleotide-binding domain-containing protein [Anaeromyxobacter sp.]|nr:cyclic nucleotide-binding domain-containing protein [Anaeromyxobacter sp.]
MTTQELLERNALFKGFTEIGLRLFAGIAEAKAFPAGAPLFVENMVGESLFIVKSGAVRLSHRVDGVEKELGIVGPGEHLGALALLAKTVRLVSAVAVAPTEVVELSHREFVKLQPEKPQACLKLALAIAADVAARMAENRDALQRLVR